MEIGAAPAGEHLPACQRQGIMQPCPYLSVITHTHSAGVRLHVSCGTLHSALLCSAVVAKCRCLLHCCAVRSLPSAAVCCRAPLPTSACPLNHSLSHHVLQCTYLTLAVAVALAPPPPDTPCPCTCCSSRCSTSMHAACLTAAPDICMCPPGLCCSSSCCSSGVLQQQLL
jgi:hypothetical protein